MLIQKFFDANTMSVHIKIWDKIRKKIWQPWKWWFEVIDKVVDENYYNEILSDINSFLDSDIRDEAGNSISWTLEISGQYHKVIQIQDYRIVVVFRPLSDQNEITIVRPVRFLHIADYNMEAKVYDFLLNTSRWILICGSPGSGKTTFTQALIEEYSKFDKIIKTVESPRDLKVPNSVVQYSFNHSSYSDIRDILLLSRPDYTIYDEVRNVEDFRLFADLRMAGIGLIGVIHATQAIDAVQRFVANVEMWIISQIIDTIVYIKNGKIEHIYTIELAVKVPQGMKSDDLARPVILVNDFMTDKPVYEIYSYGEQVVVIPLSKVQNVQAGQNKFLITKIKEYLTSIYDFGFVLEADEYGSLVLFVPKSKKPAVIGKAWSNINKVESDIGKSISVRTFEDCPRFTDFQIQNDKSGMVLAFGDTFANHEFNILVNGELITKKTDQSGKIYFKKSQKHIEILKI